MSEQELRACPWCDEAAEVREDRFCKPVQVAACLVCGVGVRAATRDIAIKLWNARPTEDRLTAELQALQAGVRAQAVKIDAAAAREVELINELQAARDRVEDAEETIDECCLWTVTCDEIRDRSRPGLEKLVEDTRQVARSYFAQKETDEV